MTQIKDYLLKLFPYTIFPFISLIVLPEWIKYMDQSKVMFFGVIIFSILSFLSLLIMYFVIKSLKLNN